MSPYIPWLISLVAVIFSGLTYFRNGEKDRDTLDNNLKDADNNLHEGILKANLKLDQVCTTTNDIKLELKNLDRGFRDLDKRVFILENKMNTVCKQVEELKEK